MSQSNHGHVTTVMHDTADLERAVGFWTAVLGLEVKYRTDRYAYLSGLTDQGPHLAFQLVPEEKAVKNRLHLDVQVDDRAAWEQRIIDMGGSKVREVQEGDFPPWSVMQDPEGNEFCIYERS